MSGASGSSSSSGSSGSSGLSGSSADSSHKSLIKLCPIPKIDYNEHDINSENFDAILDKNLAYIQDVQDAEKCFPDIIGPLIDKIKKHKECLSKGFLIDTMKDFLDINADRCGDRIQTCTSFASYKDKDVNKPLADKLQSIQQIAEENKDADMITCYSALNSLVYDIISNNDQNEREKKYRERFPEFCCIDFTPTGTIFKYGNKKKRRLTDEARQITGLCSEFDSGGDCIPGSKNKNNVRMSDEHSLCIINIAISILKSFFRPLDNIDIKIKRNKKATPKDKKFELHINGIAEPFDIKTGAEGYFTVDKLVSAINPDNASPLTPETFSNQLVVRKFINKLFIKLKEHFKTHAYGDDVIRKQILCLLMCLKTAGDFVKMFVVYFLNKKNIIDDPNKPGIKLNTKDNIYFLTHDKSAMNLALCLNIHCFGGTGSASNYDPSGTSIKFFYWVSLAKWYRTNLKRKLIGLGFKFFVEGKYVGPDFGTLNIDDLKKEEEKLAEEDTCITDKPSNMSDVSVASVASGASGTNAMKDVNDVNAMTDVNDMDGGAKTLKKTKKGKNKKNKNNKKKLTKGELEILLEESKRIEKEIKDEAERLKAEKTMVRHTVAANESLSKIKNVRAKIMTTAARTFSQMYRNKEITAIKYNNFIKFLAKYNLIHLKDLIDNDPDFYFARINLQEDNAKLNAAIITTMITANIQQPHDHDPQNLIFNARKELNIKGYTRPPILPTFLEYSIDASYMQRYLSINIKPNDYNQTISVEILYNGCKIQSLDRKITSVSSFITLNFKVIKGVDEATLYQLFKKTISSNDDKTIDEVGRTVNEKIALATITKEFANTILEESRIYCLAFVNALRLVDFLDPDVEIPYYTRDEPKISRKINYIKRLTYCMQEIIQLGHIEYIIINTSGQMQRTNINKGIHPCGPKTDNKSIQQKLPPLISELEICTRIYYELNKRYSDVYTYIRKIIELYNYYITEFNNSRGDTKFCLILLYLCETLLILVKFLCRLKIELIKINNNIEYYEHFEFVIICKNNTDTDKDAPEAIKLIDKIKEYLKEFFQFQPEDSSYQSLYKQSKLFMSKVENDNIDIKSFDNKTNYQIGGTETLLSSIIQEFRFLINTCSEFKESEMQMMLHPDYSNLNGGKYKSNIPKAKVLKANASNVKKGLRFNLF